MTTALPDEIPPTAEPVTAATGKGRLMLQVLNTVGLIVAALYFGQELFVPLTLASLLAFVLAPASAMLQRVRLPRVVAVLVAVLFAFVVIGGIGLVVVRQGEMLAGSLPAYQATVLAKWHAITQGGGWLGRVTAELSPSASAEPGGTTTLALARRLAQPLLGPLGTAGVVLVFTVFILLSSEDLRDRLVRLVGRQDMHRTILVLNDAARRLSRFFLFQLALNTGFGLLLGLCLWAVGLPNPVLWGILAALMRFVPFIGTFIAVVPPLLLAVAVVPGWTMAVLVLGLFIGCELVMGQIVEPLIYGHSTGLSPIAVIVAAAFWALLWGPVGLLISTPLTVCLVVIGRNVEALAFLDVILGNQSPLKPAETFYQRALEGHARALAPAARQHIKDTSLTDYYDNVALRGLALAQGDLSRDALAFERLEAIHAQIEQLLTMITPGAAATPGGTAALPPEWQRDGAVMCIPGRGQLDDLAATMAVQVLRTAGFGVVQQPNLVLGASAPGTQPDQPPLLCCLSVLEEGSSVSGIRYFIRRMQKRMPDAEIVVCLWHAERNSAALAELRSDSRGEHLIVSAGELLAFTQALATRKATAVRPVDA